MLLLRRGQRFTGSLVHDYDVIANVVEDGRILLGTENGLGFHGGNNNVKSLLWMEGIQGHGACSGLDDCQHCDQAPYRLLEAEGNKGARFDTGLVDQVGGQARRKVIQLLVTQITIPSMDSPRCWAEAHLFFEKSSK